MKTKFILHGGNIKTDRDDMNDNFWKEMSSDVCLGDSVLFVYFAGKIKNWPQLFEQNKNEFLQGSKVKDIKFEIARENCFIEQMQKAKVIYLRGGDTWHLLGILKKYSDFSKLIKGKTVAGSSAGAYVLSKYFYSNSEDNIFEGLGILDIKVICHYTGDEIIESRLKSFGDDLEVVKLKNFEYKVIYKDL